MLHHHFVGVHQIVSSAHLYLNAFLFVPSDSLSWPDWWIKFFANFL